MASDKQGTDIPNKSVRTALPDSTKKLGKLTVNVYKTPTEDKGDMVETQEVEDQGQVVSRHVIKDGRPLESASTMDAQQNGTAEKAGKAAGIKAKDMIYTTPSLNAVQEEVQEDLPDTLGENAKLTEKTKENKPKAKTPTGKKPDNSMSKIAKEKTGMAAKDGDRDLRKDIDKDLAKADKIIDMAVERIKKQEAAGGASKKKLLDLVQHLRRKPPASYQLPTKAEADGIVKGAMDAKLGKAMPEAEPWYDPKEHDKDQHLEYFLEEKMKRACGRKPLHKAEGDGDPMRNMRFEHSAAAKLKEHPGTTKPVKDGPVPKSPNYKVLTHMESNAKTAKNATTGGHFSAILHLAPATLAGVGNVCSAASEGCRDACLNTAGRGGMFKAGENTNAIQKARIRKTKKMAQDPGGFMDDLIHDIHQVRRHAKAGGKMPVVRLNGTSDLAWEDFKAPQLGGKNVFEAFPDIQFYDYTKRPDRVMKNPHPNYHLTFSRSEKNEGMAKRLLAAGHNVAAVFGGKQLPSDYLGHPVVSGDEHDLRFLDPKGGHVIGLTAKGEAKGDKSGFVVFGHKGDPQSKPTEKAPSKRRGIEEPTEKSMDLTKARMEEGQSPKQKRLIRDERRASAQPDPIAKPRPELVRHTRMAKAELGYKGKLTTDPQTPIKSATTPAAPPATPTVAPSAAPKAAPKKEHSLNYAEMNKIKAKPSTASLDYAKMNAHKQDGPHSPTLDYSKMPPPAPEAPRWQKRLDAKKAKKLEGVKIIPETPARGVTIKQPEVAPHGVVIPKKAEKSEKLKKDGYSDMAAGMKGAFGGGSSAPAPTPAPDSGGSLASNITGGLNKLMGKGESVQQVAHEIEEKTEPAHHGVAHKMSTMIAGCRTGKTLDKSTGKWEVPGLVPPKRGNAHTDGMAKTSPTLAEKATKPQSLTKPAVGKIKGNTDAYSQKPNSAQLGKAGAVGAAAAPAAPAAPAAAAKPAMPTTAIKKPKKLNTVGMMPPMPSVAGVQSAGATGVAAVGKSDPTPTPTPAPKADGDFQTATQPTQISGTNELAKHVKGVPDKKLDSCVSQVKAKGTGNPYAICTASLKKCVEHMRGGANGGTLQKAVVDLKSGKNVPAKEVKQRAKAQTDQHGLGSGQFLKENAPKPAAAQTELQHKAMTNFLDGPGDKIQQAVAEQRAATKPAHTPRFPAAAGIKAKPSTASLDYAKMNAHKQDGPHSPTLDYSKMPPPTPTHHKMAAMHAALKTASGKVDSPAPSQELSDVRPAPKAQGYDFNAAAKQNADKKAKQAEEIKNQDVKGKIARNPRQGW